jgi:exodeoxyribonuclease-3
MKFISWNVNGVRASVQKGLVDIIRDFDADFFCMQETKAQDHQVQEALAGLSEYHLYSNSAEKKGYSGVAILCKEKPLTVMNGIQHPEHDTEGRVITLEYESFFLTNVYVPNSGSGLKRLDYRAEWDAAFFSFLKKLQQTKPVIVTGDFNVAHTETDLARPKENYNKTSGFTQTEIDGMNQFHSLGLIDTFRNKHPDTKAYTFWSMRFGARAKNVGWRIDYFLMSKSLASNIEKADIHTKIMGSDHCPIELRLKF